MKSKFLALLLSISIIPTMLSANWNGDCCEERCCPDSALELRAGALIPVTDCYSNLYDDAWYSVQLEYQRRLCDHWIGWANVGYSHATGDSFGFGDSTNFTYVPLSFGANYEFKLFCLDLYLGAGVNFAYARAHDFSGFDDGFGSGKDREWGIGAVVKSGFKYDICECLYLNVFADYYYTRFEHMFQADHLQHRSNNFQAVAVGAGLGYRF